MIPIDCSSIVFILARCRFLDKEIYMDVAQAFAKALRQARRAQGLTQEDFSEVSSRTYVSSLERGKKSPTIEKIDALASVMGIHPLTLMSLTYLIKSNQSEQSAIIQQVNLELNRLLKPKST